MPRQSGLGYGEHRNMAMVLFGLHIDGLKSESCRDKAIVRELVCHMSTTIRKAKAISATSSGRQDQQMHLGRSEAHTCKTSPQCCFGRHVYPDSPGQGLIARNGDGSQCDATLRRLPTIRYGSSSCATKCCSET